MPSVIAVLTRHRSRLPIVSANLLLWAGMFFLSRSFTLGMSGAFRLPTYLAVLGWLVLLGWSIRQSSASRLDGRP